MGNILSFSLGAYESLLIGIDQCSFELGLLNKPLSVFLLQVAFVLEGILLGIHVHNLVI